MSENFFVGGATGVPEELDLPICLLLYRHIAHLAADALYSSPSPISIPGLWDPSDVALRFTLEVFHTLSRKAGCLQQHIQIWGQYRLSTRCGDQCLIAT